jgi:hypothetical protein
MHDHAMARNETQDFDTVTVICHRRDQRRECEPRAWWSITGYGAYDC